MARGKRGRRRRKARIHLRLDRNESPFGTSASVLAAWERQRTADPRKYGLNRYPDFFHTDMIAALVAHHGLAPTNYTPLAGIGEVGNVLAAELLRGGELVQSWPIDDPISAQARAWGGSVRRVALDARFRQDLGALAAAVGPRTRLVHVQNPHDPGGSSFSEGDLEAFLAAVAARNPDAYVWVDETFAPHSVRGDFPDCFALIGRDPRGSKLAVTRTLSAAAGIAGAPTAYLAASQTLTERTEGITSGFFVPNAYGWANPEGGVSRMGEKALLALLTADGDAHLARVRALNRDSRTALAAALRRHRFTVVASDANFVLCRPPGRWRRGGLSAALRRRGVAVRSVPAWGRRYRGWVRISVPSPAELRRLERALRAVLAPRRRTARRRPARRAALAPAPAPPAAQRRALLGAAALAVGARVGPPAAHGLVRASKAPVSKPPRGITRRQLARRAGTAAALAWAIGRAPGAAAFPPDSFYDDFNLARMIYHENPVGPSPAALEAVRRALSQGPTAARRYQDHDQRDLIEAILRYNRRLRPSARRLDHRNVMLLLGSAEGLMLAADTFVAGGTLVGEWPAYRIIRERVWQQYGTVVDVPLRASDQQADYAALEQALRDHPETGLVHFNAQNNPVGTVIGRGEFDAFARRVFAEHPRTVILVDESDPEYMEPGQSGGQPDFLGYVARGQNLVHLQTFSHMFGLTGLRVGYLMAPRALIARLRRKRISRPVSVFGHAAALAALADADAQVKRVHPVVDQGRRYIYDELDRLGLRYLRSQGQYVLLDTGTDGTAVWAGLISLGVLTRYGREWGMEGWLRVCPGLPDENERFIASLRTVLANPDPANLPQPPVPIDKLLPPGPGSRSLARSLERRLARDTFLARRLPPLRRPYRAVPAGLLRR